MILCKCGHEKKEHFLVDGKRCNCMRQCDCTKFRDPSEPDPLPRRPNHASWCRCSRCAPHAPPEAPSTEKTIPDDRPTQPMWPPAWP